MRITHVDQPKRDRAGGRSYLRSPDWTGLPASDLVFLIVNRVSSHLCLRPLVQITMICQSLEVEALPQLPVLDPYSILFAIHAFYVFS